MSRVIKERVKKYREENGYTHDYIAQVCNVDIEIVMDWETGKITPTTSQLIRLSQIYGVSVGDLVNEYGNEGKIIRIDISLLVSFSLMLIALVTSRYFSPLDAVGYGEMFLSATTYGFAISILLTFIVLGIILSVMNIRRDFRSRTNLLNVLMKINVFILINTGAIYFGSRLDYLNNILVIVILSFITHFIIGRLIATERERRGILLTPEIGLSEVFNVVNALFYAYAMFHIIIGDPIYDSVWILTSVVVALVLALTSSIFKKFIITSRRNVFLYAYNVPFIYFVGAALEALRYFENIGEMLLYPGLFLLVLTLGTLFVVYIDKLTNMQIRFINKRIDKAK